LFFVFIPASSTYSLQYRLSLLHLITFIDTHPQLSGLPWTSDRHEHLCPRQDSNPQF